MLPLPLIVLALAAMGGRKTAQRPDAQRKGSAPNSDRNSSTQNEAPRVEATRTALQAARALAAHLQSGGSFGTARSPSAAVQDAQRGIGVTPDGIVGPRTRNAARALGVVLPLRPTTRTPTRSSSTGTALAGRRKK